MFEVTSSWKPLQISSDYMANSLVFRHTIPLVVLRTGFTVKKHEWPRKVPSVSYYPVKNACNVSFFHLFRLKSVTKDVRNNFLTILYVSSKKKEPQFPLTREWPCILNTFPILLFLVVSNPSDASAGSPPGPDTPTYIHTSLWNSGRFSCPVHKTFDA